MGFTTKFLTKEQLTGFEHYKYSAIDTNPLSNYVMHPFWNHAVKLVPKWVAPNILTLTGFMLTVINALLLANYDYYFCASSDMFTLCPPIPQWLWLICAVNHFLAHTLDGIDGKHARRTNSSGPLGELMDHGLDSWAAMFMPTCLYSVFGRGEFSCSPLRVFFILWTVYLCFLFSHWEKYNTGVLYLPWGYDISQVVLLFAFLNTYFNTYKVWKFNIPILGIGSGEFIEILIYAGTFAMSLPVSLYNIYCAQKNNTLRQHSFAEAMRPLVPIGVFFVMTTVWVLYSPINILQRDPRIFYWFVGTVFSHIACRLIISQMTSTRCEAVNWMIYPVAIVMGVIFAMAHILGEKEIYLLWSLTAFLIIAHIYYGICVIRQMCDHFNISCCSLQKQRRN